jgi:hypothetical protein
VRIASCFDKREFGVAVTWSDRRLRADKSSLLAQLC